MNANFLEICPTVYHRLSEYANVWGWEIVVYLFLGGLVAGLMILTAALELRRPAAKNSAGDAARATDETGDGADQPDGAASPRSSPYREAAASTEEPPPRSWAIQWMPLFALVLISLGMGALFLDLHYKVHVYRFYLALKPASPMSWGAWILLVIYPAAGLMWLGSLSPAGRDWLHRKNPVKALEGLLDRAIKLADQKRTTVLWVNVVAGAALGVYTGLLLGTMVARIQWNSAVLGPLFLASGLSTGAAFMLLFRLRSEEQKMLVRWDMLAIVAELFFIALMLISFAGGNATAQMAGENLLGGKWTALFWSVVVVAGLVVPLIMEVLELRRGLHLAVVTPLLILVGGVALRAILLSSGQELCFCALR